jgi:hypothetical protein
MAFISRMSNRRYAYASKEEGCGGSCDRSTSLGFYLHGHFSKWF